MRSKTILVCMLCLSLCFCVSAQKKIEKERAKNPSYQYSLGIFHLNNGQVDEAIKYLNNAITLNPRYDLALDGLGLAYLMKREFDQSIKFLEKCLSVNPALIDARNHLGTVYQEMGLLDKAEQEFRTAIASKTYHSKELPYYNLSRLYQLQDKLQEALDYVNQALALNKRMVMAYSLKGQILEQLDRLPEAIDSYQQAMKYITGDKEAMLTLKYNLAVALFKNNDFEQSKQMFESILPQIIDSETRANVTDYLEIINKKSRLN